MAVVPTGTYLTNGEVLACVIGVDDVGRWCLEDAATPGGEQGDTIKISPSDVGKVWFAPEDWEGRHAAA